jgi:mRNA-degrading endonuclease RelE of RelBE toxin-antitoxin system
MRVHLSREVLQIWYRLGEEGAELRRVLEGLKKNPVPEGVRAIEGYPNRYELFVAGYWIVYEIDQSGGETVVIVSAIEQN